MNNLICFLCNKKILSENNIYYANDNNYCSTYCRHQSLCKKSNNIYNYILKYPEITYREYNKKENSKNNSSDKIIIYNSFDKYSKYFEYTILFIKYIYNTLYTR